MAEPRYTYVMRDQVRDKVRNLMRTDARGGGRRRRRWVMLGDVVATVVGLRRA